MFLLNWVLQNIFLLKPNMYIGNIPWFLLQWDDSTSFHPGRLIQHSELHLCVPESEIPTPAVSGGREKDPQGEFPILTGKGFLQEPIRTRRDTKGRTQHQERSELSCLIFLLHWMHKYLNQGQDYSYKAYFKCKFDPGQDIKEFWKPQKTANQKFIPKPLREKKLI